MIRKSQKASPEEEESGDSTDKSFMRYKESKLLRYASLWRHLSDVDEPDEEGRHFQGLSCAKLKLPFSG